MNRGERQQVLMMWLGSSSLDSRVLGWSFFDGTSGKGPQPPADPPYGTGVDALRDGWRLLQMSPLIQPTPGHERDTSFLKHEFVFERIIIDSEHDGEHDGGAGVAGGSEPGRATGFRADH